MSSEQLKRIAIVDPERCRPQKCGQPCIKKCPPNLAGKLCITIPKNSKTVEISESLCVSCGLCSKVCPYNAISIINLPTNLTTQTTHRYGPNTFKLHRLPTPRRGNVLGLIGANGTGKTTCLRILSGKMKPNLGNHNNPPDWSDIMSNFSGSELHNYFTKLNRGEIKPVIKPQNVDLIPRAVKGTVREVLNHYNHQNKQNYITQLQLEHLMDRNMDDLSGGELQRLAICITALMPSDVYIFDEPTSYLDVRQRVNVSRMIRGLLNDDRYILLVEHDMAILDYISDYVCLLYGQPGAYGVCTLPYGVNEGINSYLDGFIKSENMRIRDHAVNFKISDDIDRDERQNNCIHYPEIVKKLVDFELRIDPGSFNSSEVVVLLGENGTGKTTFIRMLAGKLVADNGQSVPELKVSYKPQKILPSYDGTVRQLLQDRVQAALINPQFITDVLRPMRVDHLMDNYVKRLSGGELQRIALILCLGTPADIYLIDEPSSYLDVEQRLIAAKIIKRFILHSKKTAFVVEHDFIMSSYIADRVIVFEGQPGIQARAGTPESLLTGMNRFLKNMDMTLRRDPCNFRPRINKMDSQLDRTQREQGRYFYLDD